MDKIACSSRCGESACNCREEYFEHLKAENERLTEQIQNLNEACRQAEKRWQAAMKEQGFMVGPTVEGPDIRD